MASVLLFYPRTGWDTRGLASLPLSALYLASALEHRGIGARIIDQRTDRDWREKIRASIEQETPVFLGISAMTGLQIAGGIEAARLVRGVSSRIPIVWGGVHPTLLAEQTLASPHVDIVAVGEGEATAVDLALALDLGRPLDSVEGIAFRSNGAIRRTPARPFLDLDSLPPLRYDLVRMEKYVTTQVGGKSDLRISTSRGCPHGCTYCYNTPFNRRRWRALSAQRVVETMEDLERRFGVAGFYLGDDNFFADRDRVGHICLLVAERGLRVRLKANCPLADVASFEPGFLERLRKAGFTDLYIGVETASRGILASIGRDFRPEDALLVNRRLARAGITPTFSFMAGFPGETIEDAKATLRLMRRLLVECPGARVSQLHLLALYPGTPLHERVAAPGLRLPADLEGWSRSSWNTANYPWLEKRHRAFLVRASFFTGFLDGRTLPAYFLNRRPIRALARIYSRILKLRIRWGFYSLMPEVKLFQLYVSRNARSSAG